MLLSCTGIGLSFGENVILSDVSFKLGESDRLAVVGVNGAGKTSLLRIICGETADFEGKISLKTGASVAYLKQNSALTGTKTVHEEMLSVFSDLIERESRIRKLEERMSSGDVNAAAEYDREFERFRRDGGLEFRSRTVSTLAAMGFGKDMLEMTVDSLSGGQRTVLSLVRVLLGRPDLLILDEPTNHLDSDALFWLEGHLKKLRTALIVVSHDRWFLDRVTTSTLEIENTRGTYYPCSYSEYRRRKQKDRGDAEKRWRDQQKEIKRIKDYIAQQRQWNRERNIIAAESREKLLAKMEIFERPDALPKGIGFSFTSSSDSGNDVLSVDGLSKSFGERKLFSNLSFEVKRGDRLFVLGPNGCGKSTLLKILCSQLPSDRGTFNFGYNVKIGYYDQENQNLDLSSAVFDELWRLSDSVENTRRILSLFGFRGDDVFKSVSDLSGGEKARLTLAKLMQQKVNVLVLDEPTNHLDILSREALENAVSEFDGTVIAVSHDRWFIGALATRILDLSDPSSALDFKGGYEAYGEFVRERREKSLSEQPSQAAAAKNDYERTKQLRSLERSREKNLLKTERLIAETEQKINEIDLQMTNDAASDYKRLEELTEEKSALELSLSELYEKWDTLQTPISCD
ncbi:MAG: ABC-F family ATP-binding cassette domain-containing protein, partial [Clostridia bacterium]|nr:ABC-F family ATP-binding cassette domain-containing protein [Clostridia bacterium]